jgi:PAS domain S-box-containing protein
MRAVRPEGVLLEELLTLAPVGLALLDEGRRYLWINRELARINGAPPAAHLGRTVSEMVPHIAVALEPHHRRVLDRRDIVRDVEISADPAHGPHWLATYYPVEIGSFRAVAVVVHEVTDRRRAEKALSEAQRLARVGSWEWSADTDELTWSAELARILGRRPDEVAPSLRAFLAAVHPDDVERARAVMLGGFERRERVELELRVLPHGGSERVVNAIGTPVLDAAGRLVRYLGTVQDVTERARSQAAIAELAAARGRLAAQILDAEEGTRRAISEMLHDHPLQELLAAQQDLAEAVADPERSAEHAGRARASVQRAARQLREAVADLHPVLLEEGGLRASLAAVAEHRGRRGGFECRVTVDPAAAGLHDALLVSLARELLTNVAKHARAGRAEVAVTRDGYWVLLDVADDGCGAEAGRTEAALREGHIGLAALARRVEALGGRLDFSSERGRGTRVRAAIPV